MQRILNGEWPPGANLPAEPELCEEFGVARGTLRQALSKLEQMGYVRRERGRGTFVANRGERSRSQGLIRQPDRVYRALRARFVHPGHSVGC